MNDFEEAASLEEIIERLVPNAEACILVFNSFGLSAQEMAAALEPVMRDVAEVWRQVYPPFNEESR